MGGLLCSGGHRDGNCYAGGRTSHSRGECAIAGVSFYLVNGLLSDAGKIVAQAVADHGWFDASTFKEPYRIEGKRTMGLERPEQFKWEMPDVILYPTGGGLGIIGIYKALMELKKDRMVEGKLPRLVAVQSTGCAPIVKAFEEKRKQSEFWEGAKTCAFGITVPKALGDFLVLDAIYKTDGFAISVTDKEILDASTSLAGVEDTFICPRGAVNLSAAIKLRESGWIKPDERVVLLNTGCGLNYPEIVKVKPPVLMPGDKLPMD